MARSYQILLPLLSLFLVRVDLTDLFPLTIPVQLVRFIDADTVVVKSGKRSFKVRLSKLDAPEKGQSWLNKAGDAGAHALACAKKTVAKKEFNFAFEKRDIYGRFLGDLDQLSLDLIKNGCSSLYPHAAFRSQREKMEYLKALSLAKRKRRGVWLHGGYRQPKLWRKKFSKRIADRRFRR